MTRLCTVITVVALLAALCGPVSAATTYQMQYLGVQGKAWSVNNPGQIVGSGVVYYQNNPGFVWDPVGGVRMLESGAYDINDAGDIVGEGPSVWFDAPYPISAYTGNFGNQAIAYAINNSGEVAGTCFIDGGLNHAFYCDLRQTQWSGSQHLDTLLLAFDINDDGLLVGCDQSGQGVIWDSSSGSTTRIGTLTGGLYSTPYAVNNHGVVVGIADDGVDQSAFIWDATNGMRSIGTLPGGISSIACGINSQGQVVGSSHGEYSFKAFVWDSSYGMCELPTPVDCCSDAYAINDQGWIVGSIVTAGGGSQAVLWTPVPEPSSMLVLLCGVGGFLWRRGK